MNNAARQARDALLLLIAAVALVAAGTTGYALASDPAPATDSAEAGFARDMRDHHRQAVEMADILRDRTTDPEIRYLAFDVANTQQAQVGMMMGWLSQWGLNQPDDSQQQMAWMSGNGSGHEMGSGEHMTSSMLLPDGRMPGMATSADIEKLRTLRGTDAEVLWLRLMVAHHRGGIDMAQAALDLVEDASEKNLAQGIVESQTSEIEYMNALLAKRGAPAA